MKLCCFVYGINLDGISCSSIGSEWIHCVTRKLGEEGKELAGV